MSKMKENKEASRIVGLFIVLSTNLPITCACVYIYGNKISSLLRWLSEVLTFLCF